MIIHQLSPLLGTVLVFVVVFILLTKPYLKSLNEIAVTGPSDTDSLATDSRAQPKANPFEGQALTTIPPFLEDVHLATKNGDIESLDRLLQLGHNVNQGLHNGVSCLHLCALTGDEKTTRFLYSRGADVNDKCMHGLNPLIFAVHRNQTEMVELFLELGADVNQADDFGRTPLHWAAAAELGELHWRNRPTMMQLLIKAGARLDAQDREGYSPAELCCVLGKYDVARWLQEQELAIV